MKRLLSIILSVILIITIMNISPVYLNAATKCASPGCTYDAISHSKYCRLHTCETQDCYNYRNNGTVYCDKHAAEWLKKSGKKACIVSGCYASQLKDCNYCSKHKCDQKDCKAKALDGSRYCKTHDPSNKAKTTTTKKSSSTTTTKKKTTSSSSKKKYDPYDVYNYKSAQDFADDKYEEFYDYEDYYDDEDEAYDAAEDYWREHHK